MENLTYIEKQQLEELFEMGGGYVLDFSNRTFQEFFFDSLKIDIYASEYQYESSSKANLLRGFWMNQSNYSVGKVINDLLDYYRVTYAEHLISNKTLYEECSRIAERLLSISPVENIDAIQANSNNKDFVVLSSEIRELIEKNKPEVGLDRLHTFMVKYVRNLCDKHAIEYTIEIALHSLFGAYVKKIDKNGMIASEMTRRILKSSISLLDAFNKVRNQQSFAHDNPILNYQESLLIFNSISNLIRFLNELEKKQFIGKTLEEDFASIVNVDNLPF